MAASLKRAVPAERWKWQLFLRKAISRSWGKNEAGAVNPNVDNAVTNVTLMLLLESPKMIISPSAILIRTFSSETSNGSLPPFAAFPLLLIFFFHCWPLGF